MSRIRILFTIPNFITAGSGRAMVNIVDRLDRSRFSPSICVRRRGGSLEGLSRSWVSRFSRPGRRLRRGRCARSILG